MKSHQIISIILIVFILAIPTVLYAALLTRSFGGKVILTTIPIVTCTGSGTGPVVLIKMNGLPYYTESQQKTPKVGDWILGRANIIPNFSTCNIQAGPYKIPFPVRTTSDYNISNNSVF